MTAKKQPCTIASPAPGTHISASGRPVIAVNGKRLNVYLDGETIAGAIEIGEGNLSRGLREAVRIALPLVVAKRNRSTP